MSRMKMEHENSKEVQAGQAGADLERTGTQLASLTYWKAR
jgi:hypothetical protein